MKPAAERILALDGLRGVAILMVMLHHTMRAASEHSVMQNRIREAFESFHIGVDLFLVISGFLITRILLEQRESISYYRAFYWRRFLRIFPLYYLLLLFLLLFMPGQLTWQSGPWYLFFASNIYMTFNGFDSAILTPLWSLALEEQFYLVWPFLLRLMGSMHVHIAVIALIISQPFLRMAMPEMFYTNPLTHLDGILIGALVAIKKDAITKFVNEHRSAAMIALLLSIAFIAVRALVPEMRYTAKSGIFVILDFTLVSVAFGIMLVAVLTNLLKAFSKLLSMEWLISFGTYSYALYLFHSLIAHYFVQWGAIPKGLDGASAVSMGVLWSAAVIGVTWLIARVSWKYIEAPILRQKERVSYSPLTKPAY